MKYDWSHHSKSANRVLRIGIKKRIKLRWIKPKIAFAFKKNQPTKKPTFRVVFYVKRKVKQKEGEKANEINNGIKNQGMKAEAIAYSRY